MHAFNYISIILIGELEYTQTLVINDYLSAIATVKKIEKCVYSTSCAAVCVRFCIIKRVRNIENFFATEHITQAIYVVREFLFVQKLFVY